MSAVLLPERIPFATHSSSDLRYELISGRVSLAPMVVLDKRKIMWGKWCVSFYVLGASHAMRLTCGKRNLTEVLSCMRQPNNLSPIAGIDVRDVGCVSAVVHDLSLTSNITRRPLSRAPLGAGQIRQPVCGYMEHEYPNADLDVSSFTRLWWQVTNSSLRLKTEHTYPHEGISIYSETTVSAASSMYREGSNSHGG